MATRRSKFLRDAAALFAATGLSREGMNISISIPDDDGLGLKGTVPISVLAQPVANLRYVRITIDGNLVTEDTGAPYEYQWDTTLSADGTHIIAAVAQYKTRKSQTQIVVTVNNAASPPPPPTPFPPFWAQFFDDFNPAPESRWSWEYLGSATTFPNPGAAVVDDGRGSKALRLKIPPATGGNGILSACYEGSGQWGRQGIRQRGQVEMKLVPGFALDFDQHVWVIVWHENQTWNQNLNSCAIGVTDDLHLRFQVSGGDVTNHQYTILEDTETLQLGSWYQFEWDILWSGYSDGLFSVKLNGREAIRTQRPTLFRSGTATDITVVGLYNYHWPSPVETAIDYTYFAVGAVALTTEQQLAAANNPVTTSPAIPPLRGVPLEIVNLREGQD